MTSEAMGIDSESLLFAKLKEYRKEIPNLISRRQYNDKRKMTSSLCNAIRERIVKDMNGGEDYFCIDSKPIEVCRFARTNFLESAFNWILCFTGYILLRI